MAASVAGVSLLAFSEPSQAEVIYTPVHVNFVAPRTQYRLDLNNDGRSDFTIQLSSSGHGPELFAVGEINGAEVSNAFVVDAGRPLFPLALEAGAPIGSLANFFGSAYATELLAYAVLTRAGDWIDVRNRYLGLEFLSKGKTYFGWARLSVQLKGKTLSAVLTGYAYENLPGHGIRAGQTSGTEENPVFGSELSSALNGEKPTLDMPVFQKINHGSLGMLALGAPGVSLWRKDTN